MKREGFWRDVTPPLNIYGVPVAVYHDLPAAVSVSVKNNILGVQRHFAVFCAPGVLRMDVRKRLPASVQPGAG